MYPIERVEALNVEVTRMVVRAPEISRKIKPGQFVMLRIDEEGERIPLTMNDCDPEAGTVTIVFQAVGATTMRLARLKAGDALRDFAGPLGNPTELEGAKRACVLAPPGREPTRPARPLPARLVRSGWDRSTDYRACRNSALFVPLTVRKHARNIRAKTALLY